MRAAKGEARALDKHSLGCRRLNITVDPVLLLGEALKIPTNCWNADQSSAIHDDVDRLFLKGYPPYFPPTDGDRYVDREALKGCPYTEHLILHVIPGKVRSCLLASLKPRGLIAPHQDWNPSEYHSHYSETYRIHVPLTTNPRVTMWIGECGFHLPVGGAYVIDNATTHWVLNGSASQERIHLILDVEPDDELHELIQASVPEGSSRRRVWSRCALLAYRRPSLRWARPLVEALR